MILANSLTGRLNY